MLRKCQTKVLTLHLGPLFIVLALTGLELGVAILQAYVSTILICIYLNDAPSSMILSL